jgi:TetR/AcrR family transcriptional repressor of nem operon
VADEPAPAALTSAGISIHTGRYVQVHRSGFQAADLDSILRQAGVTKGALYHHFENKDALGYALVDEVLTRVTREKWLDPLRRADDPIAALQAIVRGTSLAPRDVENGCPLNNLAQEMSAVHEGFRARIVRVFELWTGGLADALRRGQGRGVVRADVDPRAAASFVVAAYEGCISLAKSAQDSRRLRADLKSLASYLETLRPDPTKGRSRRER